MVRFYGLSSLFAAANPHLAASFPRSAARVSAEIDSRVADLPLVRDHLAVIRQRARAYQLDGAAKLRHGAQGSCDLLAQRLACRRAFRLQRHRIGLALAGDDEAEPSEFGMA